MNNSHIKLQRLAVDAGNLLTEIINQRDNAPVDSAQRTRYRAIGRRLEKGLAYIASALERANDDRNQNNPSGD